MVQHVEILSQISEKQGASELAQDLKQVAGKHRGRAPETLDGVTVIYDSSYDSSRETQQSKTAYSNSELTYDFDKNTLVVDGTVIDLQERQHQVLRLLIQNAGKFVPYGELGRKIWSIEDDIHARRLTRKQIHLIRRKVEEASGTRLGCIDFLYGVGYRLVDIDKRRRLAQDVSA